MAATDTQHSLLIELVQLAERRLSRAQGVPGQDISADDMDLLLKDVLTARLDLAKFQEAKPAPGVV